MPCYDDRNSPSNVAAETRKESQAHIDKLTRLLCEANKWMDLHMLNKHRSKELADWWENHQKVDKARAKKGK